MFRPRNVVHRGNVQASAFVLRFHTTPPDEARRRILSMWKRHSKVYRLDDGLLVVLPQPVSVNTSQAPGLPLVQVGRTFVGAPVPSSEAATGGFSEVRGGLIVAQSVDSLLQEDPSGWIAIEGLRFEIGQTLGEDVSKAVLTIEPRRTDIRETLKGIPQLSENTRTLLGKLAMKPVPPAMDAREGFPSKLSRMFSWLAAVSGRDDDSR